MKRKLNLIVLTTILLVILIFVEISIIKIGSQYEPTIKVVYAKKAIPAKTIITEDMLEYKKINIGLDNEKSVKNFSDIVGKKAKVDIEEGEMILGSRVGDEMKDIFVENPNNRLFSLELKPDQINAWWVKTDQRVDILFVPNVNQSLRVSEYDSSMVKRIPNVRIAAVFDEKGKMLDDSNRSALPKYISLEVTQDEDKFLAWCKVNGKIELSAVPEQPY